MRKEKRSKKRTVKDVDKDLIKVLSNVHEIEVTLRRLKNEAEEIIKNRLQRGKN